MKLIINIALLSLIYFMALGITLPIIVKANKSYTSIVKRYILIIWPLLSIALSLISMTIYFLIK